MPYWICRLFVRRYESPSASARGERAGALHAVAAASACRTRAGWPRDRRASCSRRCRAGWSSGPGRTPSYCSSLLSLRRCLLFRLNQESWFCSSVVSAAAARAQVGAATEAEVAHAARAVVEGGVHQHGAVRQQRVRRAVVAVAADAQAGLAQQDLLEVRRVLQLRAGAPVGAVAAVRGQLGREVRTRASAGSSCRSARACTSCRSSSWAA